MTADEVVLEAVRASAARLKSNEAAAIANLRNLTSAQRMFKRDARADGNHNGDVFVTESSTYSADTGPAGSAAFAGSGDTITGQVAAAGTASDGNTWSKVE